MSTRGDRARRPDPSRMDPAGRGRILVIAPQPFYEDRGTPIAVRHLLRALTQLGYLVDLATFPIGQTITMPGVRYLRTANPLGFRSMPVGFSLKKVCLDLLLFRLVGRCLRRERYVCVHAIEEGAFIAALLRRRRDLLVVYDMASSLPQQLAQHPLFGHRWIQPGCRALERWLLSRVDSVVCSAGLEPHVHSMAPGTTVRAWRFPPTTRPASPVQVAALRAALGIPHHAKVVVYTGTFAPYQGIDILLRAIPSVVSASPDVRFVLVGARCDRELANASFALDPRFRDNVRLLRRVPSDRVSAFLGLADVLVSPRIGSSNLPLKIIDYMAAGKPLVATDIDAHRSVLDQTRAVLVPPSSQAIADGIHQLLARPDRAATLAANALWHVRRRYGWERYRRLVAAVCDATGVGTAHERAPAIPFRAIPLGIERARATRSRVNIVD